MIGRQLSAHPHDLAATSIAFVTTCKGRLHHLMRTLPLWAEQAPDEIVVVDYGCPDGTSDWVKTHFPMVKLVSVENDDFNLSRARNLGYGVCQSDWICFIDADILPSPGWVDWMRQSLRPGFFYRASLLEDGRRDEETWGTVICNRRALQLIGGYDEAFQEWGGEDDDLYHRLSMIGVAESSYAWRYVTPIRHEDSERFTFSSVRDKRAAHLINQFYSSFKRQMFALNDFNPHISIDTRRSIYEQIRAKIMSWGFDPNRELPGIVLELNVELPESGYLIKKRVVLTLTVSAPE